ncbi:hypothetical protein [Massilia sp. CCM 8734]|uniref:hypothetical protein n=1 Tax=Massilia sp. CCM 8734 TaxID=2609283 RepID=UPI001422F5D7|nr:hypothetical protein [Massilia sp. CCM 8734]NHZ97649.1 hypothetical protein [Massilia sp. CCM 8734]
MNYVTLLASLGFAQEVCDAHLGKIQVPQFTLTAPYKPQFGFPPMMIPLWSDGAWPGYIGVITRWFGGDEAGFVKYYAEEQALSEIALTFDQLKAWLAFDFLCNVPDPDEVGNFAASIGLCAKERVEDYFAHCQEHSDLSALPAFAIGLPKFLLNGEEDSQPGWVRDSVRKPDIETMIAHGQYQQAWHGINSPGLERDEIAALLRLIAPFANDARFDDLATCWTQSNQ